MANQIPQQDTNIQVKTGLPVAQKVIVTVMMFGALLGGVIGGTYYDGDSVLNLAPIRVQTIDTAARPAAIVSVRIASGFTANICIPSYTPSGNTNANTNTNGNANVSFLEKILERPVAHAQATPFSIEDIQPTSTYYVDTRGNTYSDSGLKHKVNSGDCQTTLSRSFVPSDITAAVIDHPMSNVNMDLQRKNNTVLGRFAADSTYFSDGTAMTPDANRSPLVIGLYLENGGPDVNVPANIVTLDTDKGTHTLCLPSTVVPINNDVMYFFDTNGTPYTDVLLTHKVTCGSQPSGGGRTYDVPAQQD